MCWGCHWVICYWLLVIGYWLLVIGYWLLVIGYWLLVIGYWLLVVGCWLFVHCSLLIDKDFDGESQIRVALWLLEHGVRVF
ncbi:MAG: hypothetical protein AB4290_18815 [Spirulina sp.]